MRIALLSFVGVITPTNEALNDQRKYGNFSITWPDVELSDNQYYYSDTDGGKFDFNKGKVGYIFTLSGDTLSVVCNDGTSTSYTLTRTTLSLEEFQTLDVS